MTLPNALILTPPPNLTATHDVRDLVDDWTADLELHVRAGELSPTTQRTYWIGLDKFLNWCRHRGAVSDQIILEWMATLRAEGRKPAAINTWLAGVRSFFTWAVRNHRLPYNPLDGIHGAKRPGTSRKHARDALTDREVLRVLQAPDVSAPEGKRDRAMLALMAYTGARTVEVHRADVGDLRTQHNRLILAVRGKGRVETDEVIVIAHPEAEHALRDWLAVRGKKGGALFTSLSRRSRGARLSLNAIRVLVKGYYKAAGVQGNKTTHSLRHAAITSAVRHGAPVQKAREMARHASIDTTLIYYHETDRIENPAEQFIRYDEEA